jgi:cytochrome c oxidase subunit 3
MPSFYVQRHAFHLVDPSILPFISAISALTLTLGSVMYFHGYNLGLSTTFFGFLSIIACMFLWWRDVVREGTLEGHHTERFFNIFC